MISSLSEMHSYAGSIVGGSLRDRRVQTQHLSQLRQQTLTSTLVASHSVQDRHGEVGSTTWHSVHVPHRRQSRPFSPHSAHTPLASRFAACCVTHTVHM